jgi:hypothetical protein
MGHRTLDGLFRLSGKEETRWTRGAVVPGECLAGLGAWEEASGSQQL